MTFPGRWSRKSSPEGTNLEPSPPSETHWEKLKSRIRSQSSYKAKNCPNSLDAQVTASTPTERRRRLLLQIITPRPSVPVPHQPTTHRASQDNVLSGNPAVNLRSYSQVPQDSSLSNFVSEYESMSVVRPRAHTFGVRARDCEENTGDNVDARCSEQLSPCEPSSTCAPELSNASFRYEGEVPSICLSTASMAQAVRRRLRAQIRRSRLIEEDLANPGFSLDDLNFLHSAGPAETDGVAVNGAGESASNAARSVVAAAPTAPDAGLYETSLEPTVQHDTSDVQATAQPSEFHEPFDPETTAFDPTSRDSRASFSSSHSPFEYDDLVSDPAWTVENPASLNPPEEKVVECGRSVYDPVRQWFSLETLKTQGVTSSAETCERKVDSGWIESARAKEESFVAVAPTLPPRVSHAENGKLVIKVTPPTPPVTMRPQYRQRHRSMNDGMIDADSSHLTLPRLRPSARGSAESDARDSGAEGVESADETEAKSSFPAAPTPPTANLGIEPCNMGILVTPPSPLTAIKPSLSHNCAKSLGMSPDDSRVLSHHPEPGSSPCQSYNAGLDFQEPVVLAKPVPVKNYSRPFRPETDQPVGSAGYVRLSKRTDSEMFMRLIEGEAEAQNAHVKNEMLSTPSPFGRSDEIAEQLSFFDMLALGGSIDDADQTVDGVGDSSATDEAKPSFSVEPLSAFSSRKSATATRATKEPTPRPVLHHVRAFASRVTSSLRKWGKVLSKSFAHRPAQPDENLRSSPSFDRLEGLAPSRVPSPDCIGLEDALELPKPDV